MRGRITSTLRGVKALLTRLRMRVWAGGSLLNIVTVVPMGPDFQAVVLHLLDEDVVCLRRSEETAAWSRSTDMQSSKPRQHPHLEKRLHRPALSELA